MRNMMKIIKDMLMNLRYNFELNRVNFEAVRVTVLAKHRGLTKI